MNPTNEEEKHRSQNSLIERRKKGKERKEIVDHSTKRFNLNLIILKDRKRSQGNVNKL